ncbi:hypothetical protein HN446_05295 [bacterium]|jgi:small subunit ribosomal protein S6|nr:hypothetical protein [bacterium]
MKRYETLILSVPEITADESSWLELEFSKLIQKDKGSLISFDKWGKYRLAYPVRKNEYGVYFLIRFELDSNEVRELFKEMDSFFGVKAQEIVMRTFTSVLDPKDSLEYKKPPSLEDTPSHDVDTFLRENKMGGFLPKDKAAGNRKSSQKDVQAGPKETVSDSVDSKKVEKAAKEDVEPDKAVSADKAVVEKKAVEKKEVSTEPAGKEAEKSVEKEEKAKPESKVEEKPAKEPKEAKEAKKEDKEQDKPAVEEK